MHQVGCHVISINLINYVVFLCSVGNVYVADTYNSRIRKVMVSTGIITTIAGTGSASYSGDNGAATSAALYYPRGVALDASGRIEYIFITIYHFNLFVSVLCR